MIQVMFQVKHSCGHHSRIQSIRRGNPVDIDHSASLWVDKFSDVDDTLMAPEIARLEALPCRKCWIKENGYEKTGTWFVEVPRGL